MIPIPFDCPRGRDDCRALSNFIADKGKSFFCCGENNGENIEIKQDIYTVCFKGEFDDRISFNDKRDLMHQSASIIHALAIIEKNEGEDRDWSPWKDLSFD